MYRHNALRSILLTFLAVFAGLLLLSGCDNFYEMAHTVSNLDFATDGTLLSVHVIDVGQGDAIYITLPNGESMMIDGGEKECRDDLMDYLQNIGVTTIDYCIATHPHADHIGSLDDVINTFDVSRVIMPRVQANTRAFEDLLTAVQRKGLKIQTAKAGLILFEGDGLKAELLAPVSEQYSDTNNYSAVIKLTYGNTAFLFCGDAEEESEQEILASGADLSADVLKVGHHASSTSTSEAFLKAVHPHYAAISCADGNSYGHPHRETLTKLNRMNVETHRTDQEGSIVFLSDGNTIQVHSEKE